MPCSGAPPPCIEGSVFAPAVTAHAVLRSLRGRPSVLFHVGASRMTQPLSRSTHVLRSTKEDTQTRGGFCEGSKAALQLNTPEYSSVWVCLAHPPSPLVRCGVPCLAAHFSVSLLAA